MLEIALSVAFDAFCTTLSPYFVMPKKELHYFEFSYSADQVSAEIGEHLRCDLRFCLLWQNIHNNNENVFSLSLTL